MALILGIDRFMSKARALNQHFLLPVNRHREVADHRLAHPLRELVQPQPFPAI